MRFLLFGKVISFESSNWANATPKMEVRGNKIYTANNPKWLMMIIKNKNFSIMTFTCATFFIKIRIVL